MIFSGWGWFFVRSSGLKAGPEVRLMWAKADVALSRYVTKFYRCGPRGRVTWVISDGFCMALFRSAGIGSSWLARLRECWEKSALIGRWCPALTTYA
jgi:hypothetical protein